MSKLKNKLLCTLIIKIHDNYIILKIRRVYLRIFFYFLLLIIFFLKFQKIQHFFLTANCNYFFLEKLPDFNLIPVLDDYLLQLLYRYAPLLTPTHIYIEIYYIIQNSLTICFKCTLYIICNIKEWKKISYKIGLFT